MNAPTRQRDLSAISSSAYLINTTSNGSVINNVGLASHSVSIEIFSTACIQQVDHVEIDE